MSVGMDCETEGLDAGPLPYVIALFDTRANQATTFLSDNTTDHHIIESIKAMQNTRNLCTFNGTQFDFRMLAAACKHKSDQRALADLALNHFDIMLQFACENGYFSSLSSFVTPTLGRGKIGNGADVKEQWANGEYEAVSDYCADDAKLTAQLFDYGAAKGHILRTPKSKPDVVRRYALPSQLWKPAHVCLRSPQTASFMDNPPDVAGMADWVLEYM